MATQNIACGAIGANDSWTLAAGATKVAAVAAPDDDDTTRLTDATSGHKQSFTLDSHTIPAGSKINSISLVFKAKSANGLSKNYRGFFLLGGNTTNGTLRNNTTYNTFTESIARPGGGSYALIDLSTLEIGMDNQGTDGKTVTTLYVTVDFSVPEINRSGLLLMDVT